MHFAPRSPHSVAVYCRIVPMALAVYYFLYSDVSGQLRQAICASGNQPFSDTEFTVARAFCCKAHK
jgi:hypothetical protein